MDNTGLEKVSYKKSFHIEVENFNPKSKYIKRVTPNRKDFNRNYITQNDINAGGTLKIVASDAPVKD
ncbi:glycoside hydrolase domain-containing protein [Pedobacter sp. JCM 36344]|uniref:glycoside hydrolase domain-containing protein n=1 Tax=Pedobacter sp. JCM 36344 TaxID=3374280 RepID=UPI0039783459